MEVVRNCFHCAAHFLRSRAGVEHARAGFHRYIQLGGRSGFHFGQPGVMLLGQLGGAAHQHVASGPGLRPRPVLVRGGDLGRAVTDSRLIGLLLGDH